MEVLRARTEGQLGLHVCTVRWDKLHPLSQSLGSNSSFQKRKLKAIPKLTHSGVSFNYHFSGGTPSALLKSPPGTPSPTLLGLPSTVTPVSSLIGISPTGMCVPKEQGLSPVYCNL